jgi:SulP family sulfate permease
MEPIAAPVPAPRSAPVPVREVVVVPQALERCGCIDATGGRDVFQAKSAAIRAIYQKLDKSVCATCPQPIFTECCAGRPKRPASP